MSDESFDAAQKALRNRAVIDLEEPLPDEQPTRWWLRILVLVVFFAFGAIVWLSWQDNAGDGTPVLVAAPEEPIKERPADPGGMDLRNDNTAIATVLDPDTDRADPQPQVGPAVDSRPPARPVEEEVLPPSAEVSEAAPEPAAPQTSGAPPLVSMGDIIPTEDDGAAPEPAAGAPAADPPATGAPVPPPSVMAVAPEPPASAPLVTTPLAPAPAPEPLAAPRATPPAAPAPSAPPATDAGPMRVVPPAEPPAVVDTTPVPPPAAPAAPPPAPPAVVATAPAAPEPARPAAASGVRIQVASLRSEADANIAWDRVARKHPDVFAGKRRLITQAEVKGATYYRAQLEGFASRAEAQAACEALKSAGSDCLVVR